MNTSAQFDAVLLQISALENSVKEGHEPSPCEIRRLQDLIAEFQSGLVGSSDGQSVAYSRRVQAEGPSEPVKPQGAPPSEEEIARLEELTERTHLPGPALETTAGDEPAGALAQGENQQLTSAIAQLYGVEQALQSGKFDRSKAVASLENARLAVDRAWARFGDRTDQH